VETFGAKECNLMEEIQQNAVKTGVKITIETTYLSETKNYT